MNTNPLNGAALNTAPRSVVQRSAVSLQGVASIAVKGHVRAFAPLVLVAQATMAIIGRRRTHGTSIALACMAAISAAGQQHLRAAVALVSSADIALRTKVKRRQPISMSGQASLTATGHSVFSPTYDKPAPPDRAMVVLVDSRTMTERL